MMPWETNYIEGAATMRVAVYRTDGSLFCDDCSNYDPPSNGIHLCGVTDDEEQPTTVAAYGMPPGFAEAAFNMAREVAAVGKDEADFIVDLLIDDDIVNDFYSNRQVWPRAIEAWNAAALKDGKVG